MFATKALALVGAVGGEKKEEEKKKAILAQIAQKVLCYHGLDST
jgi:hypothetical protein